MRGVTGAGGYIPCGRLERASVAAFLGSGGGKGTRSVAWHDEDTTTMGVQAARFALLSSIAGSALVPDAIWFATTVPAYADKTNATAIHAALGLPPSVAAFDFGGALRSAMGALKGALEGSGSVVVVGADTRDGLPGSPDESGTGDASAALVVGDDTPATPLLARYIGGASATDEFVDRWRGPGERRPRVWEERFGETRYVPLGTDVVERTLRDTGVEMSDVRHLAVTGMHSRAVSTLQKKFASFPMLQVDDLAGEIGQAGCAHPLLSLVHMLENSMPGDVIFLVHLADGADTVVLRATEAISELIPAAAVSDQLSSGRRIDYSKFLAWRQMLTPEPPRRPGPQRVAAPAAWRNEQWKFALIGSRDRRSGALHMPPSRISMSGGNVDDMVPEDFAHKLGTVVTFTVDRLAYSPSPPIVFAVVDFDGGGRFPMELTDVDAEQLSIGDRVEVVFRRLYSVDGIHDYFYKARPLAGSGVGARS